MEDAAQDGVRKKLETDFQTTPVFLPPDMGALFLGKFCGQILWQMLHSIPPFVDVELMDTFQETYNAYCAANQRFYDVVTELYEDGDLVLVYDYHLMLLPLLLRRRFPNVTCSFTLTCPFPSTEFFRVSPVRQELLRGVLGADLVTFSDYHYLRHFENALIRILGLECDKNKAESSDGRVVFLGVCPPGIDPRRFESTPAVQSAVERLKKKAEFAGKRLIVSMDRLDMTRGIPHKLLAFEEFLLTQPQWQGKVVLVLIAPSGDQAQADPTSKKLLLQMTRTVCQMVGRLNGEFGGADYIPVQVRRGVSFTCTDCVPGSVLLTVRRAKMDQCMDCVAG